MSATTWFWIGGIAILLFAIGGLLWSRHKSKQEEEAFRRSKRSVGRILSPDELRHPFGQPSIRLQPASARVHRLRTRSAPVPAVGGDDSGIDIDLDAAVDVAEAAVAGARIIGAAIAGSVTDEETDEPEVCRRPDATAAVTDDTEEDDGKPQAVDICVADDDTDDDRSGDVGGTDNSPDPDNSNN